MANIAIVTDTSSDLTPHQAASAGVRLVPLTVSFGDETFEAVTELSNEDFYRKLTAPGAVLPRTAAPNPAQFEAAFRAAFDEGADGVVCITLSGRMSATYSSAVQAASAFEAGLVEVIDTLTVAQPMGLMVRRAADLARTGAGQAEVIDHVLDLVGRTELFFTLHTLEYLQRGGRIGRASALLGTVLSIKPILTVEDGEVATVDKKRTFAKARARLIELAGAQSVEQIAVLHTGAEDVDGFCDEVARVTGVPRDQIEVSLTGPVAGTHVGPGMIGVTRILPA
jgi:DegV family protein with EDD domain